MGENLAKQCNFSRQNNKNKKHCGINQFERKIVKIMKQKVKHNQKKKLY